MTAVVGPASRHRLRPIGAVSRGWVTDEAPELGAYAQSYQGRRCHLKQVTCHLTKQAHRISFPA